MDGGGGRLAQRLYSSHLYHFSSFFHPSLPLAFVLHVSSARSVEGTTLILDGGDPLLVVQATQVGLVESVSSTASDSKSPIDFGQVFVGHHGQEEGQDGHGVVPCCTEVDESASEDG